MTPEDFLELARLQPEPQILVERRGAVVASNPAAEELLGLGRGETAGRRLHELLADPPSRIDELLARFARGGSPVPGAVSLPSTGNGPSSRGCRGARVGGPRGEALLWLRFDPADGPRGHFRLLARKIEELTREIHERRRLQGEQARALAREADLRRDAERMARLKDEFLATLSHELRTPVHAILGWSQLLEDAHRPELVEEGLAAIGRSARSQAQLVEDLLDVSRIVTGRIQIDSRSFDLEEVVRAALDSVRFAAEAKQVRVVVEVDPDARAVRGDAARLQQVAWNLLSNAIKFSRRGGEVAVRLEARGSWVQLAVRDDGEGIAPEQLPFVFDRFRQADASTTRRHQGLGLGLAIVRHLVELHGGTVHAESEGVGRGATFTVLLPRPAVRAADEDVRPESTDAEAREDEPRLDGARVLLVEDHDDSRLFLSRLLEDAGAEVTAVDAAERAVQSIGRQVPDLVVSDVEMPGEDGLSLVRRIRSLGGAAASVPAVAVTAHASPRDRMRALEAGFHSHVAKPVDARELVLVLRGLLGSRSG